MEQVVRLKERFLAHEMDGILGRLYQDPNAQVDRYVRALDAYAQIYDGDEEVFFVFIAFSLSAGWDAYGYFAWEDPCFFDRFGYDRDREQERGFDH